MKKTILLLLCCLLLCGLFACKKSDKDEPSACLSYDIELSLEENVLSGKQTVTFTNVYKDNLESAVFHLYPNAYVEGIEEKAYNGILSSYGGIEVTAVTVGGAPVTTTQTENDQYLIVPLSGASLGSSQTIEIAYEVTIPTCRLRFGRYENNYLLSSFYPQLSVFKDGAFLTDPFTTVGDPLYSEIASYAVSFRCPSSLVVASGAKLNSKTEDGEFSTYKYTASSVRDFALAASPDFTVVGEKVGETELYLFSTSRDNNEELFSTVKSAFSTFTDTFGQTGLEVFSVVILPFDFSGMEYSGIVYVTDVAGGETTDVILHETAHQWWYHLVGSDPIRNSALDEGLTSFSALYYYLLSGDQETFSERIAQNKKIYTQYETLQKRRKTGMNLRLDSPIYDYTGYQYTMLMYHKACMLFNNLYELYGKDKLNACLRSYAEEFAHKEATFDDFVAVCNRVLKTDVSGLVNGWISDNLAATTFSQE